MTPSKILVVEDENSLRTLYKQDLEHEGYAVVTADDAYGIKSADTGELRAKIRQVLQPRKIGHA